MQYTENYHLKKPQMSDFASVEDISENMDTIDAELANPSGDGAQMPVTFSDDDLDSGISSFPTFLTKIVSGMKLAKFLRDFKAGMAYVLHVGDLINNATCTESGKALDARMGKTLQDQITSLNDSLAKLLGFEINLSGWEVGSSRVNRLSSIYIKYGKLFVASVDFTVNSAISNADNFPYLKLPFLLRSNETAYLPSLVTLTRNGVAQTYGGLAMVYASDDDHYISQRLASTLQVNDRITIMFAGIIL